MKGVRAERDLVRILLSRGVVALRVPASGARRKETLPDVIAGYKGRIAFFEVKHAKRIYLSKARLKELSELARRFGGEAFIAFRPKGTSDYYIIPADEAPSSLDAEKAKLYEHLESFVRRFFFRQPDLLEMIGLKEPHKEDHAEADKDLGGSEDSS